MVHILDCMNSTILGYLYQIYYFEYNNGDIFIILNYNSDYYIKNVIKLSIRHSVYSCSKHFSKASSTSGGLGCLNFTILGCGYFDMGLWLLWITNCE